MSQQITTAFVNQYKAGVEIKFQQEGSRLRPFVDVETQNAEFEYYDQIGSVEATEVTTRHGDTTYTDTPHTRRRNGLRLYDIADLIDKADKVQALNDPTNPYAMNQAMALGRSLDRAIINAATGTAYTGKNGETAVTFPAGNIIAANYVESGSTAPSNLTWGKLRRARFLLEQQEAVKEGELINVVYTAMQKQSLLKIAEEKNINGFTMQRIESGQVGELLGFRFIRTELVSKTGNNRGVLVFPQNAIKVGIAQDITVEIDRLPTKRYSVQVYTAMQFGATRMWEERVLQINCDETVL